MQTWDCGFMSDYLCGLKSEAAPAGEDTCNGTTCQCCWKKLQLIEVFSGKAKIICMCEDFNGSLFPNFLAHLIYSKYT